MTVTATANSSTAVLEVQGKSVKSGAASGQISLDPTQPTTINITVSNGAAGLRLYSAPLRDRRVRRTQVLPAAGNSSSITYLVTVSVAAPTPPPPPPPEDVDATLKNVRVLPGKMEPAFAPKSLKRRYNVTEPGGVTDVKFEAIRASNPPFRRAPPHPHSPVAVPAANRTGETLKLDGKQLESGVARDIQLVQKHTVVELEVTSKDTSKMETFEFSIDKKPLPDVRPPQQTFPKLWRDVERWEQKNTFIFYAVVIVLGSGLVCCVCNSWMRSTTSRKRKQAGYYGYEAFYSGGGGAGGRSSRSSSRDSQRSRTSSASSLSADDSFFPGEVPNSFGAVPTDRADRERAPYSRRDRERWDGYS